MSHADQACFGFALERPETKRPGTVWVDELHDFPSSAVSAGARSHGTRWCHLWAHDAESVEELHRIARAIGLKLAFFQNRPDFPHYDLVPSKRPLAIASGAREKSLREWLLERRGKEARNRPVAPPPRFAIITNPSPIDRHSVKPPRHIRSDRRWYNLQAVPAVYRTKAKTKCLSEEQCEYCLGVHDEDGCPCYDCGTRMHPKFIVCVLRNGRPTVICPVCDEKTVPIRLP